MTLHENKIVLSMAYDEVEFQNVENHINQLDTIWNLIKSYQILMNPMNIIISKASRTPGIEGPNCFSQQNHQISRGVNISTTKKLHLGLLKLQSKLLRNIRKS